MSMMCRTFTLTLDTVGPVGVTGPLAGHAETCDTCGPVYRATVAMDERLAGLDGAHYRAPDGFQPAVMSHLGPGLVPDLESRTSSVVPIAAAVATAAVATAAAGTAVILRLRRVRAA